MSPAMQEAAKRHAELVEDLRSGEHLEEIACYLIGWFAEPADVGPEVQVLEDLQRAARKHPGGPADLFVREVLAFRERLGGDGGGS